MLGFIVQGLARRIGIAEADGRVDSSFLPDPFLIPAVKEIRSREGGIKFKEEVRIDVSCVNRVRGNIIWCRKFLKDL